MRSIASLFLVVIISYPVYFYLNYVIENTHESTSITYRPIEPNILDLQFNYHKIK
jgi:hypothetical protein